MPQSIPIMPFLFLLLLALPFRISVRQLRRLAFLLWFAGGMVLVVRGIGFMGADPARNMGLMLLGGVLALLIGVAKGKFVLSKTSQRNVERLEAFTEPQKPVAIYSVRSWIMISIMVGISLALNFSNLAPLWRGVINLGIGTALLASSLAYLYKGPQKASKSV